MAAIKNAYSTTDPAQTMGQIQALLAENKAAKVQLDYEDGEPVAVSFLMPVAGSTPMAFRLTVNPEGLLRAMKADRNTPNSRCNIAQAKRTAWKNKLEWLQLQLAEVKTGQADLPELLMSAAITDDGRTVYERVKDEPKLLSSSLQ